MLVKCIQGLIWAGLHSEVWTVFLQADQLHQPECQIRPNVYEFDIASALYQPTIVILIRNYMAWTDEKSLDQTML